MYQAHTSTERDYAQKCRKNSIFFVNERMSTLFSSIFSSAKNQAAKPIHYKIIKKEAVQKVVTNIFNDFYPFIPKSLPISRQGKSLKISIPLVGVKLIFNIVV